MKDVDWTIIATLYRTHNITRTAEMLFLTQPALTKRIQKMEEEMGVPFIIRTNKGIRFTHEGEHIAQVAMHIADEIQNLTYEINEMKDGRMGILRFGTCGSVLPHPLNAILSGYRSRYSQFEISIGMGGSADVAARVVSGDFDCAMVRDSMTMNLPRIHVESNRHFAVNREPFEIDDLPDMNMVWYPYNFQENIILQWWHERFSKPWRVQTRADNRISAMCLVQAGMGFGITSDERFVERLDGVYCRPLVLRNGEYLLRDTWFVWNRAREDYLPLQRMIHYISGKEWQTEDPSTLKGSGPLNPQSGR